MKVNQCKCGILKNVESDKCSVCITDAMVASIQTIKAGIKAANTARIKENNARNKKQ